MMFGLSYLKLFILGATLAVIALATVKIYNAGYASSEAKWTAIIEQERKEQEKAIKDAVAEAWKVIDYLNGELEKRNELIDQLNQQGDADPDAASGGITADSVQRINRSRAPRSK